MKKTKKIRTEQTLWIARYAMLTLGIVTALCISNIPLISHAQGHSHHLNNYNGMAYIAEQQIRTEQQKTAVKNENNKIDTDNKNIVDDRTNEEEHFNDCRIAMPKEAVEC
jgi:hypothetical protein